MSLPECNSRDATHNGRVSANWYRRRLPVLTRRWQFVITMALVAVNGAVVVASSVVVATLSAGVIIDYGTFGPAGAQILTGQWSSVFDDPSIQAGPFELGFWGVPWLFGVNTVAGWSVFFIIAGAAASIVFAAVVQRAVRDSAGEWSTPLAVACAVVAALIGSPVAALSAGHPAQLAVPIMWVAVGLLARRGRPLAAAVLLGLTTGWELWGILGVPLLLLAPRLDARTVWRSAVGGAAAIGLLFGPFLVLGPFSMFGFAWPVYSGTLPYLLAPDAEQFPWVLRLAQAALSVAAGAAVALVLRRRRDSLWLVPLTVCSVRLLFDPVALHYYTVAPVLLAIGGLALCAAQGRWWMLIADLVILNVFVDIPSPTLASGVACVVLAATVTVAARTSDAIPLAAATSPS